MGILSMDQAREIKLHLQECPHCRAEVAMLERYLEDLKPDIEYSLKEQIKIWIAQLIPAPGPGFTLAPGLRGDEINGLRRYTIGGEGKSMSGELTLDIQDDPALPGRRILLGLLTGPTDPRLRAELWQNGQPVAKGEVDEFGNLSLSGLAYGTYDLLLLGSEFEIHVQDLKV